MGKSHSWRIPDFPGCQPPERPWLRYPSLGDTSIAVAQDSLHNSHKTFYMFKQSGGFGAVGTTSRTHLQLSQVTRRLRWLIRFGGIRAHCGLKNDDKSDMSRKKLTSV